MGRLIAGLMLAAATQLAVPAAHADARREHAAHRASRPAPSAAHHHAPTVYGHPLAPRPAIHRPHTPHFIPPVHHPVRAPVVAPVITPFMAPPRPVFTAPRVVTVPVPYYVVVGSGYTGTDLAYPAEPDWKWTPVESIAALAGRRPAEAADVRYYCPDTRDYYPYVETCASPWLKVLP